jgi:hypothetical protein
MNQLLSLLIFLCFISFALAQFPPFNAPGGQDDRPRGPPRRRGGMPDDMFDEETGRPLMPHERHMRRRRHMET